MITVKMKRDGQYSFDGITATTLRAGETYEVSQDAWNNFYAQDLAEKINPTSDAPVEPTPEPVAEIVAEPTVEPAPSNGKRQTKDVK